MKQLYLLLLLPALLLCSLNTYAGEAAFPQPPVEVSDATRKSQFNQIKHQMELNAKIGNWKMAFKAFDELKKSVKEIGCHMWFILLPNNFVENYPLICAKGDDSIPFKGLNRVCFHNFLRGYD